MEEEQKPKKTRRGPGVIHSGNPTGRPQRSSAGTRRKRARRGEPDTYVS
jgi:hypothetical protein